MMSRQSCPCHLSCVRRYIFKELANKGELLWSRVVDCETEMVFGMEQEEMVRRRRLLVTVRGNSASSGPQYLASHYRADSSLSQDISR